MKETMEALESLGINMDSGEMRVLQSVLRAGLGSERPTFERICSAIKESKGRAPKRAWVYRCLDNLEADGFISIDKLQRPRLYSASRLTMISGLEHARRNRIAALEDNLRSVTQSMQLLDNTRPNAMSAFVYEAATGGGRQPVNSVIRGVDNVRRLIRNEILDKAVPGDTMRLTHRLDNLAGIKDTMSVIDEEILSAILKGVDMHVVLIPSALASDMSAVSQVMLGHQTQIMEALKSRHLVFKMYSHDIQTYRLLALNNEKLIMILTHAWRPDTVVLFNRDEHPVLVDNAIQTFDRLWNESVDAAQLLAARLQKLAEPVA
jgi:Fe2+ or Zn2+ uptake regulation protein